MATFGAYSKHPWKSRPLCYFICFFKTSNHVIQLSSVIYCGLKERSRRGPDVEMLINGEDIKRRSHFVNLPCDTHPEIAKLWIQIKMISILV